MAELTAEQQAALAAPFHPRDVDFRPQGDLFERDGKQSGRVVAYVDARTVAARLDAVVGPLNWSYDYDVIIVGPGKAKGTWHDEVLVVKGRLTICGVLKADLGDSGDSGTEPSKSAVSDGLKRAAVLAGPGRYLYELGAQYVAGHKQGNSWVPDEGEVDRLRMKLPLPPGAEPYVPKGGKARPAPPAPRATAVPSTAAVTWDQTPRIGKADQDTIRSAVIALGWASADCVRYLQPYQVDRFGALSAADGATVAADLTAQAAAVQALPAMADTEAGEAP